MRYYVYYAGAQETFFPVKVQLRVVPLKQRVFSPSNVHIVQCTFSMINLFRSLHVDMNCRL